MHRNPIPGAAPGDAEDSFDGALLGLLVYDDDGLWSVSELSRTLASGAQAAGGVEPGCHEIEDALARLFGAGLVHRVGQFVFASRAGHVAQRLVG